MSFLLFLFRFFLWKFLITQNLQHKKILFYSIFPFQINKFLLINITHIYTHKIFIAEPIGFKLNRRRGKLRPTVKPRALTHRPLVSTANFFCERELLLAGVPSVLYCDPFLSGFHVCIYIMRAFFRYFGSPEKQAR